QNTRRDILKGGLAVAGLGMLGIPEWALPALAQGETVVAFTDIPENVRWETPPDRRLLDVRTIEGPFTPKDKFATTQHYGHPEVDMATYKLKISGLVDKPLQLTLDDVKKFGSSDLVFGFECSGNRGPIQGLCGNGKWTGVPLKKVLDAAGVKASAREFVFFGADKGEEEVEWRTQKYKIDVPFGRSLNREKAMSDWPFLAWALNGEPLSKHQGKPLRLLTPGWYGVANVKWLSQIHIQEDAYLGKYQARWYRTVRGEMIDGEMKYMETAVTHMNPKSFVARVTKNGAAYKVLGVILNDGTGIKTVEVKVDDGPWQAATLDPATAKDKYGWKLFTYAWNNVTPGEHTLVSRVTQVDGKVQPTEQELETKKSFLEQNSQAPRKVKIA
ncbi:MAG TPA: molybdopterin-dependent oxidoreductase, partial [Vicinamibacterales bacterium]|nr:molybdopterin-dependent oxidoreductase [Vicinamibacterales bacterium]